MLLLFILLACDSGRRSVHFSGSPSRSEPLMSTVAFSITYLSIGPSSFPISLFSSPHPAHWDHFLKNARAFNSLLIPKPTCSQVLSQALLFGETMLRQAGLYQVFTHLVWVELCPPKRYVEVLTPGTSYYDFIWT